MTQWLLITIKSKLNQKLILRYTILYQFHYDYNVGRDIRLTWVEMREISLQYDIAYFSLAITVR